MRQHTLIALGMLVAGIAVSARAQDAMVQQKPAEKNRSITSGDQAAPDGKAATASKLTDKSTDATVTDPANPATNAAPAKH